MKFHKMHGAGNDYVYVDLAEESVPDPARLARFVSNRNFGIGADGLILIAPATRPDAAARMIMYNADGSEGSMCGNGVRCVAKYLFDRGRIGREAMIETKSGVVGVAVAAEAAGKASAIRVAMGRPRLRPADVPTMLRAGSEKTPVVDAPLAAGDKNYRVTCVSMGNPHAVIFHQGIDSLELARIGPPLENHAVFPARANIEFVEVVSRSRLRQRTWERGSGETLACGTGASAVLVAAVLNGLAERRAEIELRGGVLDIEWREDDELFMTGPAVYVFAGRLEPGAITAFCVER
jgi:diaminopimelate epimerase